MNHLMSLKKFIECSINNTKIDYAMNKYKTNKIIQSKLIT